MLSFPFSAMRQVGMLPLLIVMAIVLLSVPIQAQSLPPRPDTQQLLPETTVALVKLRDFREFAEKMQASSGGQMLQSQSVEPLLDSLYQNAANQYEKVRDQVGLTLEEIRSLPSGEITLAIIAPRRKDLAFVVMMETDPENEAVDKALDRGRAMLSDWDKTMGGDIEDEFNDSQEDSDKFEGVEGDTGVEAELDAEENEFNIRIEKASVAGGTAYFCKHDGLFIGSSSKQELEDIFTRWSGEKIKKVRPLAENRKFITISKRCAVSNDQLPDARMYVDPIGIFKAAGRGDPGMQFAIALLPTLGLDGLLAAGGNFYVDHENYESIIHGHLLLASPKEGVLNALALKPGTYTPEPWVPVEVAQYMTTSWDVPQMMDSIKTISDKIIEGQYDQFFENVQDGLEKLKVDADLRTDFIDHLSGRVTVVRPILSGTEINGIGNTISLGISDFEPFEATLRKFMASETVSQWWAEKEYGAIKFWARSDHSIQQMEERRNGRVQRRRERAQERAKKRGEVFDENPQDGRELFRKNIRQPAPAFGIVGENLIISDSEEFFEMAVDAFNGDRPLLADDENFLQNFDAMTDLLGTDLPAAVFYFDSVREIEFFLKMLDQGNLMAMLENQSQNDDSGFLADVKASFDDHGIPAMDSIKEFLSVSGGCISTDESGYHILIFQERPGQK